MFGIGMPEFLLIMAIALIVIGPKKLPDLAKALGKALGEFKKATSELKDSMEINNPLSDVKRSFDDLNHEFKKVPQGSSDGRNRPEDDSPIVEPPPEEYLDKPKPDKPLSRENAPPDDSAKASEKANSSDVKKQSPNDPDKV